MKNCKIHSGGKFGTVVYTVYNDKVIKGNSRYGTVVYTINGDKVMEGNSRYGKTAFTIYNDKIIEGNSRYGKVLFTIVGDTIVEGNSRFGSKGFTIEYEETKSSASHISTSSTITPTYDSGEGDRIKRERESLERERRNVERERQKLEEERKKLEYEKWYNSLTPAEKEAEDRRIEEEKRRLEREAEEGRIREEEESRRLVEQRELEAQAAAKSKKKRTITLLSALSAIILLIVGIIAGSKIKATIDEHNTDTYKLLQYLENSNIGYKDGVLTQYIDMDDRGRVYFNLEYVKGGWTASSSKVYDFRVTVVVPPKEDSIYTNLQTSMCFNLSGSDNKTKQTIYSAKFTYSTDYAIIDYTGVTYDSLAKDIVYQRAYLSDTRWDETATTLLSEYKDTGWAFMSAGYVWINEIYNQATGKTLDV